MDLKYGFTTGSSAAAASKAAILMLLSGKIKDKISISTPKGITFNADIKDIKLDLKALEASCAVEKNGGDDPDITTGLLIYSKVSIVENDIDELLIDIDGGEGVGRVTKPGLDQPVGNAAINSMPRKMIEKEVREVAELYDFKGKIRVLIYVPFGRETAKKTFNERLGIIGGISILGTSGIVEPMSDQALLDTIRVELNQRKALGDEIIAITPGNYGQEFMLRAYDYQLDRSVKCSNFIGDTIDMAAETGFKKMLLTGHIGKLIKLSGGIYNTHSKNADARMELLLAAGIRAGLDAMSGRNILDAVSTEEGIRIIKEAGCFEETMKYMMEKIMFFLNKRASGKIDIECIVYSNNYGLLAKSDGAEKLLDALKQQG